MMADTEDSLAVEFQMGCKVLKTSQDEDKLLRRLLMFAYDSPSFLTTLLPSIGRFYMEKSTQLWEEFTQLLETKCPTEKKKPSRTPEERYDKLAARYRKREEKFSKEVNECLFHAPKGLVEKFIKGNLIPFFQLLEPQTEEKEDEHCSRTTSSPAFIEERGQKTPDSGAAELREQLQDRRKWSLDQKFTGSIKWHAFMVFLFIVFQFAPVMSIGYYQDKHAYCHVRSDEDVAEWRLTCQFQEDLRESKQDFRVYRIENEDFPDVVVDGTWIKDKPVVYTEDGYTHDGVVSDKVVIKMERSAVPHGRIHACVLTSGKLQDVKTCKVPKAEELNSTQMITTPMYVPMTNKGSGPGAVKELLVVTVALINYAIFRE